MALLVERTLLALWMFIPWPVLASVLTDVDVYQVSSDETQLTFHVSGGIKDLKDYRLDNPPRVTLDLADTRNGLEQRHIEVDRGGIGRISVLEGSGRTRLLISLTKPLDYSSQVMGEQLQVSLHTPGASRRVEGTSMPIAQKPQITGIDFQRGPAGAGRLLVTLDRDDVAVEIQETARRGASDAPAVVRLPEVTLADAVNRIYDVSDFATPVRRITPRRGEQETQLAFTIDGAYAMLSSQSGRVVTIDVQPVEQQRPTVQDGAQQRYTGERMSLNVQDMDIHAVLATLAEFTGLNLIASESVTGRITLNLEQVPWDQALALILHSQGLASREHDNVILVAPAGELAEIERQQVEAQSYRAASSSLVSELIEVKYARAEDLAQLLRGDDGFGLLTERGRISIDPRTNSLWVRDTAEQVESIMQTLARLDVPVRQVQIEARIVIARDTASRELGVNWGVSSTRGFQATENGNFARRNINPDGLNRARGGLAVDLGSPSGSGAGFSFGYLSGDVLLDLELRALESEGKSQTISQPRVITANQRTAIIRQGEERAFQSVDVQGNPDTQFKEAELSLEVTPQITPDNRIIMDLVIKNDSFRESGFGGEPPIDTNQIETQVLVDDGQTVVLGGILTTEQLSQMAKTPLLGDIPLLGRLFRYTAESNEKVELLVFITPRLLDDGLAVR